MELIFFLVIAGIAYGIIKSLMSSGNNTTKSASQTTQQDAPSAPPSSPAPTANSDTRQSEPVLSVLNTDTIVNGKQECIDFCRAAAQEFVQAAEKVGLEPRALNAAVVGVPPAWPVTKIEGGFLDRKKWAEYWVIVYNTHNGMSVVDAEWSAVIAKDGDFYLSDRKVSLEDFVDFIAARAEYDRAKAEDIFTRALRNDPITYDWL